MDATAKVTQIESIAMTSETDGSSVSPREDPPVNGVTPVAPVADTTNEVSAAAAPIESEAPAPKADEEDEAMNDDDQEDDADSESEEDSEDDDSEEESEVAPTAVALVDATGRPLSDIEIAAQYAAIEIRSSLSVQFASTVVDASKPAAAPMVPSSTNGNGAAADAMEDDEDDDDDDDKDVGAADVASSGDDDSSDEDGEIADDDDPRKLRAEIEAAMEKEENKVSGPLKTANEVAAIPVREPDVKELTPDCPIARCGIVLNVSRPGLIVTVKSDSGVKPLDEGSVLCFADRTVLGCVDEVFGPVLMPMYLVRFENADKIPAQVDINVPVYYATEHTTYIIPENIRDKGTDASNIFDEETDETIYSDDEAEAAAKRQNRKRNRDNAHATAAGSNAAGPSNFSDYQGQGGRHHGGGGRGRGRGGRGGGRGGPAGHSGYGQPHQSHHHHPHSAHVQFQAQPHGGVTRYTSPGYGQPGAQGYYQPPGGVPGYAGAPPFPQGQYPPPPPPAGPVYSQPLYGAPQALPPYPPQAPLPNYYAQPPPHAYEQAPPPPPPPGHYGPSAGYYQQPNPNAYNQQGHHHPPPPPGGPYGPPGGRHH